ncbi:MULTISPECIES: Gfo/Idh/MocA family protein [Sphingobacterium]|uniref:Gfo/Idh/MocA family protein n=1 Tax=Sphingobacterium TaxID=28453 RepID=UPI0010525FDF|nr:MULTISPECIES: Gfo/Idh/MocA family oxidoreductase [Sphingobacterium]MCW2258606.1 hypothetical protein [Sphingobacterium kitahiroshimense]TCR14937.1 oxidoreductase family protein [Sphingobacterium sp. JUb78]
MLSELEKHINIILIGCGPHARRVYIPAFEQIENATIALIIDLKDQEAKIRESLDVGLETSFMFIDPFEGSLPDSVVGDLSEFLRNNKIDGVVIATEPLVHYAYAKWALANGLNILMDKPITTRANVVSSYEDAKGILDDYEDLLHDYNRLQNIKETVFIINSHRRFHKGFQFVQEQIREVATLTKCPVTFIQAYHSDGQWRLPNEIVTQNYHPYCTGYGKASHSGYHIFDTIYQFYKASIDKEKIADQLDVFSSFVRPNGFIKQITENDYKFVFGHKYNAVHRWTDRELSSVFAHYGEMDLSSILTLKKEKEVVANFSVNLVHNGFAGRTWVTPRNDLYKGNGRIKHENYIIQQGPFQSIQIHAYQGNDRHDTHAIEEDLGGKNHFDIYVFRNPLISNGLQQPQVYKVSDLINDSPKESGNMITMEWVKFKVVEEFVAYLSSEKLKSEMTSLLDDHLFPVQIMSGTYRSNIDKSVASYSISSDSVFGKSFLENCMS